MLVVIFGALRFVVRYIRGSPTVAGRPLQGLYWRGRS
jgi:hypothetical protein